MDSPLLVDVPPSEILSPWFRHSVYVRPSNDLETLGLKCISFCFDCYRSTGNVLCPNLTHSGVEYVWKESVCVYSCVISVYALDGHTSWLQNIRAQDVPADALNSYVLNPYVSPGPSLEGVNGCLLTCSNNKLIIWVWIYKTKMT